MKIPPEHQKPENQNQKQFASQIPAPENFHPQPESRKFRQNTRSRKNQKNLHSKFPEPEYSTRSETRKPEPGKICIANFPNQNVPPGPRPRNQNQEKFAKQITEPGNPPSPETGKFTSQITSTQIEIIKLRQTPGPYQKTPAEFTRSKGLSRNHLETSETARRILQVQDAVQKQLENRKNLQMKPPVQEAVLKPIGSTTAHEPRCHVPASRAKRRSGAAVISVELLATLDSESVLLAPLIRRGAKPGSSVLVWRKGSHLISAGHHLITSDKRFFLQSFNLQLRNVRLSDQGDYTCQIGDGSLGDLIHTVEILIPPNLQMIPPDTQVTAKQGGGVVFECQAGGNPMPIVQWSKKDGILPSGLQVESGSSLSLSNLQKHHAGLYQCTASNGIGQPATAEVKLQVLYPPDVHVVRSWTNSADSLEARLNCLVNADPPAEVMWYQNSFPLQPTDRRSISSSATTSTLTIRNVQFSDFGNYSCVVVNSIGKEKKYIEVSGKPGIAEIVSPGYSNPNDYKLTWNVQSVFPILEAKILFRRLLINTTYHHHDQWHDMVVRPTELNFNSESTERMQQYHLIGLIADSVYECLIQTKSQYGYSELSNLHQWFTSRAGRQIDSSSGSVCRVHLYSFFYNVFIVSWGVLQVSLFFRII